MLTSCWTNPMLESNSANWCFMLANICSVFWER